MPFPTCHHSVEDEDDSCDQLTFQIQLCPAIQDLIAIFHRMVVVALVRFSGCKDSPVLADVGELQVRELLVKNPLPMSLALAVVHRCV